MIGRDSTWSRDDCGCVSLGFTGFVEMFGNHAVVYVDTGADRLGCSWNEPKAFSTRNYLVR